MENLFNVQTLINTLNVQTTSYNSYFMEKYIRKFLDKNAIPYTTDNYGNIYATKGIAQLYPTMVCHVDTVHDINMDSVVKRHNDILYSIDSITCQRTGIGGDDKVGVYITLELLKNLDTFKGVFFKDEEVGCVGSGQADMSFFNDSTIVLQCDRKGMGDFVTAIYDTELADDTLINDIQSILDSYDRKVCDGGLTDVKSIATKNKVQVANVNCGYYMPHTDDEIVSIDDVNLTLNFCYDVFIATQHKRYELIRETKSKRHSYKKWTYPVSQSHDDWNKPYEYEPLQPEHYDFYGEHVCQKCDGTQTQLDTYSNEVYCYACDEFSNDKYATDEIDQTTNQITTKAPDSTIAI